MNESDGPSDADINFTVEPFPASRVRENLWKSWGKSTNPEDKPTIPKKKEDLLKMRDAQIDRMVALGFHNLIKQDGIVGMDEDAYRISLDIDIPPLMNRKLKPDSFVIVDPRIPLNALKNPLNIDNAEYLKTSKDLQPVDLEHLHEDAVAPTNPYIIWVNTGIDDSPIDTNERVGGIDSRDIQDALAKKDLRGLTVHELFSVLREQPEDYASVKQVYALGSLYQGEYASHPTLYRLQYGDSPIAQLKASGSRIEAPNQVPSTVKVIQV